MLPIDLPLVSQAPVSNDTMDEHVKRLKANLAVTAKLVKSAMERTKEKNKDLHDLSQKQVVFDVGEMVRYWHLPKSTNGNAIRPRSTTWVSSRRSATSARARFPRSTTR